MSQEQDALDSAYQRANADAAERPSSATRQVILEQAAKSARQHTPAANDSRFVWRAVAGVAVLGVAVLVWRQVDQRMPGQAPQVLAVPAMTDAAPTIAATQEVPFQAASAATREARTPSPSPPPPASPPPEQVLRAELASVEVEAPIAANESLAIAAAAPAPPAALDRSRAADSAREPEASDLLREHFPAASQSRERRTVWLVRDAQGTIVASGELGAAQQLDDITNQLAPTYGASLGNWRTQTVTNDRNQSIVVAIAELRP
jgi:hypothetical protein